ncbi:MAG: DUF4423 domain-containing protein [Proteobacteria bacterium]|nr:DUF4423 domain-containing protein [Pseudomonadota bacterium]
MIGEINSQPCSRFLSQDLDPIGWLRSEYARRRSANPQYSLRAFSKKLGVAAGRLTEIFDGKRQLTSSMGKLIAGGLEMEPKEVNEFIAAIERARVDNRRKRPAKPADYLLRQGAQAVYDQLSADEFHLVSDWYHFAILNLIATNDFRSDNGWIAKRLGITSTEVEVAITRLERLDLLRTVKGKLQRIKGPVTTTNDVPSAALKISHKQSLEQANAAIDDVAIDLRDVTSMTMAVNLRKIPEAKKIIREFRRNLAALLEEGQKEEVYNLNIQLIPITKVRTQ